MGRVSGPAPLTFDPRDVALTRRSLFPVDLSVAKYRTEKPSKSPPPPPPRRSFPSAHGLTTNRTGDVIITAKSLKVGSPAAESDWSLGLM